MGIRAKETIPESAAKLYEQNDKLRNFHISLDMIVQAYSYLSNKLLPEESQLIT
ncbi:unnamed protein product, partial [Trichobilharzia regenti]